MKIFASRGEELSSIALFLLCLLSRVLSVCMCILADVLGVDHIAQGVSYYCRIENSSAAAADFQKISFAVSWWLEPFVKWDSAHYLNIARNGYRHEKQLVFLPLFPTAIRLMRKALLFLGHFEGFDDEVTTSTDQVSDAISYNDSFVISAVFLNMLCYSVSCVVLVTLFERFNISQKTRTISVWIYLANPASIFFTTAYTESLYSLLSWSSMLMIESDFYQMFAVLPLALASFTRSNGILNATFIISKACKNILTSNRDGSLWVTILQTIWHVLMIFASVLPLFIVDSNNYASLCNVSVVSNTSSICNFIESSRRSVSFLSTPLYTSLQEKHWNVGFMKYYQFKQIPNFLLSIPILMIAIETIRSCIVKVSRVVAKKEPKNSFFWFKSFLFQMATEEACLVHLILHLIIGVFFSNIQIVTRMVLSACPILYVTLADFFLEKSNNRYKWALLYVLIFNVIGTFLHVNHWPWT